MGRVGNYGLFLPEKKRTREDNARASHAKHNKFLETNIVVRVCIVVWATWGSSSITAPG
jgi:hypothetical protein